MRLIKVGVLPERIAPGKPQQNGRHERLHRTVKEDTASPPAADVRAPTPTEANGGPLSERITLGGPNSRNAASRTGHTCSPSVAAKA